tara:strand:+ start:93 stop:935 length:843 start_codon:yes stop_codon:yes gene_type:complete
MAQPASREELKQYCLRQLGAPVLEINLADEQCQDLIDDAVQYFQERHYDGICRMYLKYELTEDDINRGQAKIDGGTGITTTSTTADVAGSSITFNWKESSNYIQVPPAIIGVNKVLRFDGSNTMTNNMFSVKYQMFLNDIYYWGSTEILTYAMVKTFLSDLDFALNTEKQIRFNQRMDRLYLDIDWGGVSKGDIIIMDCFRALDPSDHTRVWNDPFLKRYLTAIMKRQWGQNLIKFQGVKLPGGIELNGRQIYDDAQTELDKIQEMMSNTYELPPLDMIG